MAEVLERRSLSRSLSDFEQPPNRSSVNRVSKTRRFRNAPVEERFSGLVCERLTQALFIAFRRDVSDENGHCMDAARNSGRTRPSRVQHLAGRGDRNSQQDDVLEKKLSRQGQQRRKSADAWF
jgi:hypothetical protein